MLTEVNMNVATYIKFDDISNALLDIKPTRLASLAGQQESAPTSGAPPRTFQLEASFNAALALSGAIERLNGGPSLAAGQQTPSLGKCLAEPSRPFLFALAKQTSVRASLADLWPRCSARGG